VAVITMLRILLLLILIWILYAVLKRFIKFVAYRNTTTDKPLSSEKIVACHHCGLHIPESETNTIDDAVYCNNPDCQPK
jgi:uncharacterized protein